MRRPRRAGGAVGAAWLPLIWGSLVWMACARCSGCGDGDAVAELSQVEQQVQRDVASAVGNWRKATHGERFQIGDGVRTGPHSHAVLRLMPDGKLLVESDTIVRFTDKAPGSTAAGVAVEAGEVTLDSQAVSLEVLTAFGIARMGEGSRVRLQSSSGQQHLEVLFGRVQIDGQQPGSPQSLQLEAGERVLIDVGQVVLERVSQDELAGLAVEAVPTLEARRYRVMLLRGRADLQAAGSAQALPVPQQGAMLERGGSLEVAPRAAVTLTEDDEVVTVQGPAAVVIDAQGAPRVSRGRLSWQTGARVAVAGMPGGSAQMPPGARAEIDVDAAGAARLVPNRGELRVRTQHAEERIVLGETAHLAADGTLQVDGRAPARVKLSLPSGESATIHDPRPPTRVRITFTECAEVGGYLEISGGRSLRVRGKGGANVQLDPGRYTYRMHCMENGAPAKQSIGGGTLRVMRDAAVRRLPPKPQSVQVDADGLKYTVRYANWLPQITLRWPAAPTTQAYSLWVASGNGAPLEETLSVPKRDFPSGTFNEGTYRFHFQAADGRRSPESQLSIVFDNTASTAYLSSPPEGFREGGPVRVAGAALARSEVRIAGRSVGTDAEGRFVADVEPSAETDAIAIRVAHPGTGVHYYLRHPAGAAN